VPNGAIGGSPVEVILTLTATAPGASAMTLAPCADPGVDAECANKAVPFTFRFLDPDAVREHHTPYTHTLNLKPCTLNPEP